MRSHAFIFTVLVDKDTSIRTGNIESLYLMVAYLLGYHVGQNIPKISGILQI